MFAFTAPPTFLETPPAFVEVRDREALSLTCTAIGNPQPVVIWKRSDLALQSGDAVQVSTAMLSIPRGGTLGLGGESQGAQRRSPCGWRASPGYGATVLRASVATGDVAGEERDAEHRRGGARQRGHLHVPRFQQGGHHHPHHPRARAG